ncbi:alpha-ketoglutarate-dependent dioxygenase AlkB family protein [Nonomuraea fuscirosea]|uniref:alpha-ketoglutarate-dependent dioxygenase AlkB family protein n=1 Tax=Nonomuraea fuscirosea TaxID=1291556 RepID=UPI0033D69D19
MVIPLPPREIAPGAVHVPGWLTLDEQRHLVDACRAWAQGPVPIRHTVLPRGGVMSVQTVCVGWHWQPYRYTRLAHDVNGRQVADFPGWLADLGRRALSDAYGPAARAESADGGSTTSQPYEPAAYGPNAYEPDTYEPDTALINFYDGEAKMGMHQDKDEKSDAPVVSLSIGDACLFRFGNPETRGRPYTDVRLASGDLFVFGGPSRFAYHGVPKVYPGTGDPTTGLTSGRLNLTMRVTGLR